VHQLTDAPVVDLIFKVTAAVKIKLKSGPHVSVVPKYTQTLDIVQRLSLLVYMLVTKTVIVLVLSIK